MSKIQKNRAPLDEEKVSKVHDELIEIFQRHKLKVGEILIAYGNLGYTLGASIAGYTAEGPAVEELKKMYYQAPTVGVAMMLQGITTTSWYEDLDSKQTNTEK